MRFFLFYLFPHEPAPAVISTSSAGLMQNSLKLIFESAKYVCFKLKYNPTLDEIPNLDKIFLEKII